MEDILASIRKMISEERLGPRPIPDQIARSNFGSGAAARTETPEPRPAARTPAASPDRSTPEFSSLSDALKKAASDPAADQRRSLDEKIADMLEKGPATEAPADPLARFAAGRPAPAPSIPQARTASPSKSAPAQFPRPQAPRTEAEPLNTARKADDNPILNGAGFTQPAAPQPHVGLNGSVGKPAGSGGTVVPLSGDQSRAPASDERGPGASKDPSSDAQRVIAMPTRQPTAFGHAGTTPNSGLNGKGLNGSGTNGSKVASIGPRLDSGNASAPVRTSSLLGDADRVSDKIADELMEKVVGRLTPKQPAKPAAPDPTKADAGPAAEPPKQTSDAAAAETPEKPVFVKATEALSDPDARAPETDAPLAAAEPGTAPSGETPGLTPGQLLHAAAKEGAAGQSSPSEALIDAVVDMVHKEPDSLSVFTSGSAFIHGVNERAASMPAAGGAPAGGLDRSAAELLRPMLRQWLADNMPRIVEEALRSELMSSTGGSGKDADKG
jgi:cell pole-organizing protein PopZ